MKIVVLSDHASEGGAAQATSRIAMAIHSERTKHLGAADVVRCKSSGDFAKLATPVQRIVFFPKDARSTLSLDPTHVLWHEESALQRQLYRIPRKLLPKVFPYPNAAEFAAQRLRKALRELEPDIINIHNLHTASPWGWGPQLVEVCLQFAPVVWTLHDMWAFTGRCAYSYECERFVSGCDATCPTPHERPKLAPEKIRAAWDERQKIYDRHRDDLIIVTPSRWLADHARRGLFARHWIEIISNPLSATAFANVPRENARQKLGMSASGLVLLIAAQDLTERRKGADFLPSLWKHVRHRPFTVLTMGNGTVTIDDPHIDLHALGWIDSEEKKTLAYSAADALLHPSPMDNLPNVVSEALACGTPAIGMPVGGLPEMIRPGVSGWLADAATPAALGQAVDRAFQDLTAGVRLGQSCVDLARTEYSMERAGRRYCELFDQLSR